MVMADDDWGFSDATDARAYLGEVRRLWVIWAAGMVLLVGTQGATTLMAGVMVVIVLILSLRPLQRRAERLVPDNTVAGSRWSPLAGRATARDKALRSLAYGVEPIRDAIGRAGAGRGWVLARHLVVAGTLVGFVWVVLGFFSGWDQPRR